MPFTHAPEFVDQLIEMHGQGMNSQEIAREVCMTDNAVRRLLSRRGVTFEYRAPPDRDWWHVVQTMQPLDAVNYLHNLVENCFPIYAHQPHPVDAWDAELRPVQRRICILLYDRMGQPILREHIVMASMAHVIRSADETASPKAADTHICNIRKQIKHLPFHIETVVGIGYRMLEGAAQ